MLKEEIKKYIAWCKKYYYKPNEAKSLKAYMRLNYASFQK